VKQVDHLLSNQGIDVQEFFTHWVPYVIGEREPAVVALDWTSFPDDGYATIALMMLTGHGHALPPLWKTVGALVLKRSQTEYEDAVLQRLHDVLPDSVRVTIVAALGFADVELYRYLEEGTAAVSLVADHARRVVSNASPDCSNNTPRSVRSSPSDE
jgi:hypothetical protein